MTQSHRPTGGGGADRYGRSFLQETDQIGEWAFDEGAVSCEATAEAAAGAGAEDTQGSARLGYRCIKRAFDIVLSLIVLALCSVPVAVLCVVIWMESEGSPLYRQRRVGYRGRPLDIFKLRTMVADSDDVERYLSPEQLAQWQSERKVDGDPRITRVGSFLRRTSLDELPQFLNVFAGSMSVIGPRPVVEDELAAYGDDVSEFLSVKPGITGWWQVQARNDAVYGDGSRQELELYYARNASFSLDVEVFFGTFKAMFGRTGR